MAEVELLLNWFVESYDDGWRPIIQSHQAEVSGRYVPELCSPEVLDVVAGQLGIADPSCVKRYTEREKTRLDHAWEIQQPSGCAISPPARLS